MIKYPVAHVKNLNNGLHACICIDDTGYPGSNESVWLPPQMLCVSTGQPWCNPLSNHPAFYVISATFRAPHEELFGLWVLSLRHT